MGTQVTGEKIGEIFAEIRLKFDKMMDDLKKSEGEGIKTAKKLENTFANASLRFNDRLLKMTLSEVEQTATKLRANLERKIKMNAPLGDLEALKSAIDRSEGALNKFHKETEKPPSGNLLDQASKWGMISSGIQSAIATVRQFTSEMKALFGNSIIKAANFEEMASYFEGTAKDLDEFRRVTKETVGSGDLIRLSNMANDLGIEMKEQPVFFALAKRAQEAYGAENLTMEAAMMKIIMATEGQTKGLGKVGIETKVYTELVDELAKAHGGATASLDAGLQKELRKQALLQLGLPIYQQMINSEKSAADKLEGLGVSYQKAQKDLGAFILEGLKPLIKAYDESGNRVKMFISSIVAVGSVVVGAIPLIVQLYSAKKIFASASLLSASAVAKETVAIEANTVAKVANSRVVIGALGWVGALAAVGVGVYELTKIINENTNSIKRNREEADKAFPNWDKSGFGPKNMFERGKPQTTGDRVNLSDYLESHNTKVSGKKTSDEVDKIRAKIADLETKAKSAGLSLKELLNINSQIKSLNEKLSPQNGDDLAKKNVEEAAKFAQEQLKQDTDLTKKREENLAKYYEEVKFKDKDYFGWKSDQIMHEIADEKVKNEVLKKLVDDKYEYEKAHENPNYKGKSAQQILDETLAAPYYRNPRKDDPEVKESEDRVKELKQTTEDFGQTLASSFAQGATSGENLINVFRNMGVEIENMVFQAVAFKSIMALLNLIPGVGSALEWLKTPSFSIAGMPGAGTTIPTTSLSSSSVSYSMSNNFSDGNIVRRLDNLTNRVEALTMATIKQRNSVNKIYLDKQIIAVSVTEEQNNMSRNNYKVD